MDRTKIKKGRDLHRQYLMQEGKRAAPGLALFLAMACLFLSLEVWRVRDLRVAPLRSVTTTVTGTKLIAHLGGRFSIPYNTYYTSAMVEGHVIARETGEPLPKGASIIVTYRKGKSGGIYVENIVPVTPPKR